jgi:ketosteroid isomerase-like protein
MKQIFIMIIVLVAVAVLALNQVTGKKVVGVSDSEAPPGSQQLYNEIERMDGVLFDAFNTQNLNKLKTLFTDDLEFYQDNEGLALYQQTMKDFKSMFEQNNKLRRELVKGSLEVYPIKNYGAIEIGLHKFCHIENGKDECGTFKFVHVWQNKGGEWKISRVISYNH